MNDTILASIIGGISTISAAYITFRATKENISKITDLEFETTDYVKHLRSHRLPIDGIRQAFLGSTDIDELSLKLKGLSNAEITCEFFDPMEMKTTFLTPINNVRSCLNLKTFEA